MFCTLMDWAKSLMSSLWTRFLIEPNDVFYRLAKLNLHVLHYLKKNDHFWEILVWKCLNKDWLCHLYTFCNEVRKPPGPNVFRRLVLAVNDSKYCKGSHIERFWTQILWKTISKNLMHSKQISLITDCERFHVHKWIDCGDRRK